MMKDPKLVIADIDGTLIEQQNPLPQLSVQAMKELHARGVQLGIASGRQIDTMMKSYPERWGLDFPFDVLIGMNGGQLYIEKTQEMHEYYKLSSHTLKQIIDMMAPLNLNPFVYEGEGMLCKEVDEGVKASILRNGIAARAANDISELYAHDNSKLLYRVDEEHMPAVFAYAKAHPSPDYHAFLTQTTMLEFADPRVSKGMCLQEYCRITGMSIADVWAFGDMENDNELLMDAGWGVCLSNGSAETKAVADAVTELPVSQDGFGHYIMDYCLNAE